jgi:dTDP-4-amino-4,6-dideoxygalactose transaminase
MWLKRLYLEGRDVEKSAFRALSTAGESVIAAGAISAMTPWSMEMIRGFGVTAWRQTRRRNFNTLSGALSGVSWLTVLTPSRDDACPFSVVIVTDSPQRRNRLRERLIEARVYPATLWPLEEAVLEVPHEHRDLSRRILALHCDGRYGDDDLGRVADEILRAAT